GDSIEIEIYSNKGETKKKKKEGEGEKNEEDKGEEGKSNSKKENAKNEDNPQQVSLKNSDSPLNNIKLTCEKYEYFFMNIIDATKIEPFSDFIELLMFFKNKMGTNIIMKFSDVSSIFISEEDMLQINRVYFLTDTFFMNTNDALKNFNEHYNYFCKKQKEKKPIDLKTIHEYFINTIACRGQMCLFSPKILFLIDEVFSNLQMVEVGSNGKSLNLNYSVKPYPPISPSNVEKVTEYKYILKNDYPRYEGLFFSGILSQLVFGKDKKPFETLYSSYLVGLEILKKVLEFDFNNIPLPVSRKFYKVKLNQDHVKAMSKKAELEAREGKFVLDCTNLEKSTLRYYVPLFDKDLHEYFQNNEVQRELKNKGFIDTKGFVNYDPIYKSEMIKLKRNKIPKNVIRKALDSDKQIKKKFMENIKEREKKGKRRYMLDTIEPTIVKLPVNDCWAMRSLKEMNKKIGRFKCRHGERRECKFCYLKGLARSAEDIEEFNRKKSQLRRFDS
ncbi:MAG: hypothetical protein MJ252_29760, partial [archaeon]|nr:hypothetical protein [archaeon]